MKHGKAPTVAQKILIKSNRLNPDNWLVVKNLLDVLVICHRHTGTIKELPRGGEVNHEYTVKVSKRNQKSKI